MCTNKKGLLCTIKDRSSTRAVNLCNKCIEFKWRGLDTLKNDWNCWKSWFQRENTMISTCNGEFWLNRRFLAATDGFSKGGIVAMWLVELLHAGVWLVEGLAGVHHEPAVGLLQLQGGGLGVGVGGVGRLEGVGGRGGGLGPARGHNPLLGLRSVPSLLPRRSTKDYII